MKRKQKVIISQTPESTQSNSVVPSQYSSDIEDFEDSDSDQNKVISSTKKIQTNLNNDNKNSNTIPNSPIEGFSDEDEMDGLADDNIFPNNQTIQKINLAKFQALEGLKDWNIDQSSFNDDMEDDMENDVNDQSNEDGKKIDINNPSFLDIIFSDDDNDEIIDIKVNNNNNNNNNNNANSDDNKNVNNMKNTQHDQSKKNTTINSQCLSDIISDSQSTFDEENTSGNSNNNNYNNNNNNSNNGFQISSLMDKKKIPTKRQLIISIDQQQQQNKKNVYNQPTFSLANNNKSDTLIELKNLANNYHTHSFKKDGLASAALNYIKNETNEYQNWQQSVKIALAKHGTVAKIWRQWKDSRLCRLINVWSENGIVLGWCVDINEDEEHVLTRSHGHHDDEDEDDNMMKKDTILEIDTQPTISLPAYDSSEDKRQPYLCMFSFAYDYFHSKTSQTKLLNAEYIAIWPPWTAIPITLNNEVYHIHIITRFVMDDYF